MSHSDNRGGHAFVVMDERYAQTKEALVQSGLRQTLDQMIELHGTEKGTALFVRLVGRILPIADMNEPKSRSTR